VGKQLFLFALLASATPFAFAQPVSFGLTGGVPLLYGAPTPCCSVQTYTDESRPYTVGGSVEFRLPAKCAIEVDALYRRLGVRDSGFTAFTTYLVFSDRWRGNAWAFPLLVKRYFRRRESWQPFLGAGMAMRYLSRQHDGNETGLFGSYYEIHQSDQQFIFGETGTAGVRFHTGRVAWLPQFRYTHWHGSGILTESNDASLLLGILF
jgi:hypothetical protein